MTAAGDFLEFFAQIAAVNADWKIFGHYSNKFSGVLFNWSHGKDLSLRGKNNPMQENLLMPSSVIFTSEPVEPVQTSSSYSLPVYFFYCHSRKPVQPVQPVQIICFQKVTVNRF